MRLHRLITAGAVVLPLACGTGGRAPERSTAGSKIGIEPLSQVHLYENHSSSLIAWRRAGAQGRIVVHLDGHADLDWLPDATIARIAAADPDELPHLELHPYVLDGTTHQRFAIWNFLYPAARLGVMRSYVWVVPDGTLPDAGAAEALVQGLVLRKMQKVTLDEAHSLHREGRVIRGTILGVDTTICELADLPVFDEPVLLDVDLDFLTTRSATTQEVTEAPWIDPASLVARLRAKRLRADLATVSYSTFGGFLPPSCRWLGRAMTDALEGDVDAATQRAAVYAREAEARVQALPDDAAAWYALSLAEARAGRSAERETARARAVALDPVLSDAGLFEADALFINGRWADALAAYRDYRRAHPIGPFTVYGLRREASCLARLRRDDEAIATLRRVVAEAPQHGDSRLELGVLLRESGDVEGAVAEFREARRILPDQGSYAMALGTGYAREGRVDDALSELADAVRLRPTWAAAQANLGGLLIEAGRPAEAAVHLDAAAFLDPGDPAIRDLRARVKASAR
ncbi:MAG TPA: tetratricopeptide repeat protein [Candidatus Polarisedimenticolaceae bacterium]|nr:tetratricopeptide repeat protein [Candidatus Polarisedimenticolaceae bacterium]